MRKLSKYLIFITVLLIPFYIIRFNVGPIPTTILEIFIYLSFVSSLFSKNIKEVLKDKIFYFALLFVLLTFISVLVDPDVERALGLYKAYFVDGLLFFVAVLTLDKSDKKRIIDLFIISSVMSAILSLSYFFSGIKTDDGRLLDLDRLSPNYLAMSLIPGLILSLGIFFRKEKTGYYYLYAAASAILLIAIYFTNSRGAIIALLGSLIVAVYFLLSKRSKAVSRILLIISILVFIVGSAIIFRPKFSDIGRSGSSSNIRYYIWTTSLKILEEHPVLGIGLSNYQDYFTNYTKDWINYPEFISPQALTAHNLFLHLYLTSGLLSIISFLTLVVLAVKRSKNTLIIIVIVGLLFYSLVDTPFFRNDLSLIFWMLLALL